MRDLDYYLTEDHAARQRTTMTCLVVAGVLAVFCQIFGLSLRDTAIACVVIASVIEIGGALIYTQPSRRTIRLASPLPSRRAFIRASAFAAAIVIAVLLQRFFMPHLTVEAALDSATREAEAGNMEDANKHVEQASQILEHLKAKRVPAHASFFEITTSELDQLPAGIPAANVHEALTLLAEYRASINEKTSSIQIGSMKTFEGFIVLKDGVLSGPHPIAIAGAVDGFPLNGSILDNVTFQDTLITYDGTGPTKLHNVRFVNCRFRIPISPQGSTLLRALTKQLVSVQIGEIPAGY